MLHGCVEVALLEWLHVVHLLHEVDIVLPTETTKLKLFKTLKLLLNVNSLHGISGATTSTIKTSSSTDFCNTSFNFHRNRVVQFNLQQLVGLAVDACAITNKRWRLLSAQLSNKFGYCHLWTVSIILAFDKHNRIPLGQIGAFISFDYRAQRSSIFNKVDPKKCDQIEAIFTSSVQQIVS